MGLADRGRDVWNHVCHVWTRRPKLVLAVSVFFVILLACVILYIVSRRPRKIGHLCYHHSHSNDGDDATARPLELPVHRGEVYSVPSDDQCVSMHLIDGSHLVFTGPSEFSVPTFSTPHHGSKDAPPFRHDARVTVSLHHGHVVWHAPRATFRHGAEQRTLVMPRFRADVRSGRVGAWADADCDDGIVVLPCLHAPNAIDRCGKVKIHAHCRDLRIPYQCFRMNRRRIHGQTLMEPDDARRRFGHSQDVLDRVSGMPRSFATPPPTVHRSLPSPPLGDTDLASRHGAYPMTSRHLRHTTHHGHHHGHHHHTSSSSDSSDDEPMPSPPPPPPPPPPAPRQPLVRRGDIVVVSYEKGHASFSDTTGHILTTTNPRHALVLKVTFPLCDTGDLIEHGQRRFGLRHAVDGRWLSPDPEGRFTLGPTEFWFHSEDLVTTPDDELWVADRPYLNVGEPVYIRGADPPTLYMDSVGDVLTSSAERAYRFQLDRFVE